MRDRAGVRRLGRMAAEDAGLLQASSQADKEAQPPLMPLMWSSLQWPCELIMLTLECVCAAASTL